MNFDSVSKNKITRAILINIDSELSKLKEKGVINNQNRILTLNLENALNYFQDKEIDFKYDETNAREIISRLAVFLNELLAGIGPKIIMPSLVDIFNKIRLGVFCLFDIWSLELGSPGQISDDYQKPTDEEKSKYFVDIRASNPDLKTSFPDGTLSIQEVAERVNSDLRELEKNFRISYLRIKNETKKELEENLKDIKSEYEQKLKSLRELDLEINGIRGSISTGVLSNAYEQEAEKERSIADTLRKYAIAGMVISALTAGYIVFFLPAAEFSTLVFASRISLITILVITAVYLSSESNNHRNLSRKFIQLSLALKTIDPYLSSLPDKDKIKSEMANRFFMMQNDTVEKSIIPIDAQKVILELIGAIKDQKK